MKPPSKRRVRKAPKRTSTARKPTSRNPSSRRPANKTARATPAHALKQRAQAPAPVLNPTQRKRMRGLAHGLQPIVLVGHAGVTDEVLTATKQALLDHELIKVRLREPEDKQAMAEALATGTASALCGLVGHTVILYRPNPENPRIQ